MFCSLKVKTLLILLMSSVLEQIIRQVSSLKHKHLLLRTVYERQESAATLLVGLAQCFSRGCSQAVDQAAAF